MESIFLIKYYRNRKGRIGISENDNLQKLANDFGKLYGLSENMKERLHELLIQSVQKHAKKPRNQHEYY